MYSRGITTLGAWKIFKVMDLVRMISFYWLIFLKKNIKVKIRRFQQFSSRRTLSLLTVAV